MKNKRTGIIGGVILLLAMGSFVDKSSGDTYWTTGGSYIYPLTTSFIKSDNVLQGNYHNLVEINPTDTRGILVYTHGNNARAIQAEGEATGDNQTVYGVYGRAKSYGAPLSNLTCYAGYFDTQDLSSSTGNFWSVYAKGDKNYFEGKVGIGTTTPSVKLDVNGTIKSTNPCAKGYRTNNVVFGSPWTWIKIQLNAKMYDVGGNDFNTANHRFTAPTTGYYQVNASIFFYDLVVGAGNVVCASIRKNGNSYSYVRLGVHTAQMSVNVSDIIQMNAGDFIELWGFYAGTGICRIAGNSLTTTYMSVRLAQ